MICARRIRLSVACRRQPGYVGLQSDLSHCLLHRPPQIKKAEYTLAPSRLAVLVEVANPEEDNPLFVRAFHERFGELLSEHKIFGSARPTG